MKFIGKTVVISGGASGIGRELAIQLIGRGAYVAIGDINEEGLKETVRLASLKNPHNARIKSYVLDTSKWESWETFKTKAHADFGKFDGVINNAGINVFVEGKDMSKADLEKVMQINFFGMVYGGKIFMDDLLQRPEAFLANLSSLFGFAGGFGTSAYCASKFAIRGYTESLMTELKDTNLHVASIHPGHIGTPIARNAPKAETADVFDASGVDRQEFGKNFEAAGTKVEDAVKTILNGLEKKKSWITVGPDAWFVRRLVGLMPTIMPRLLDRYLERERVKLGF